MDLKTKQYLTDTYFRGTEPVIGKLVRDSPLPHDKVVINICARSGSSRLRDKNIRPLCGIPLLAYSILVARELGADRVTVSTDSEHYADIAREYGAEVPFLRPPELSQGDVSPGLVTYYMQKRLLLEGYPVGTWLEMYPTTPFRNVHTLRGYMRKLDQAGNIATVFAPNVRLSGLLGGGGDLRIENEQDYRDRFSFYKLTSNFLGHKLDSSLSLWRQYAFITNPLELLDIDTAQDFALAEEILAEGLYDFGVAIC